MWHDPDDAWFKRQIEKRDEFTRQTIRKIDGACSSRDLEELHAALANLLISTAAQEELIGALEAVNRCEMFYRFDDNSAGGAPRPTGAGLAVEGLGTEYIEVIRRNQRTPAPTLAAKALQSHGPHVLAGTIDRLLRFPVADASVLPLLRKLAKADRFEGRLNGLGRGRDFRLGAPARRAIALTTAALAERAGST